MEAARAANSVRSLPLKGGGRRRPSAAVLSAKNADAEHRLWWGSRDNARRTTAARLFDPHPTVFASQSEAKTVDLPLAGGGGVRGTRIDPTEDRVCRSTSSTSSEYAPDRERPNANHSIDIAPSCADRRACRARGGT